MDGKEDFPVINTRLVNKGQVQAQGQNQGETDSTITPIKATSKNKNPKTINKGRPVKTPKMPPKTPNTPKTPKTPRKRPKSSTSKIDKIKCAEGTKDIRSFVQLGQVSGACNASANHGEWPNVITSKSSEFIVVTELDSSSITIATVGSSADFHNTNDSFEHTFHQDNDEAKEERETSIIEFESTLNWSCNENGNVLKGNKVHADQRDANMSGNAINAPVVKPLTVSPKTNNQRDAMGTESLGSDKIKDNRQDTAEQTQGKEVYNEGKEEESTILKAMTMENVSNKDVAAMFSELLTSMNSLKTELKEDIKTLKEDKKSINDKVSSIESKNKEQQIKVMKVEDDLSMYGRKFKQLTDVIQYQSHVINKLTNKME